MISIHWMISIHVTQWFFSKKSERKTKCLAFCRHTARSSTQTLRATSPSQTSPSLPRTCSAWHYESITLRQKSSQVQFNYLDVPFEIYDQLAASEEVSCKSWSSRIQPQLWRRRRLHIFPALKLLIAVPGLVRAPCTCDGRFWLWDHKSLEICYNVATSECIVFGLVAPRCLKSKRIRTFIDSESKRRSQRYEWWVVDIMAARSIWRL